MLAAGKNEPKIRIERQDASIAGNANGSADALADPLLAKPNTRVPERDIERDHAVLVGVLPERGTRTRCASGCSAQSVVYVVLALAVIVGVVLMLVGVLRTLHQ